MELCNLPSAWETAELSEICLVNPTIDKSAIADDLAVSFVPMPAVEAESGGIDVSATRKFGEVKKGYTPFREGDVLFAKITPCMENGKMAVVPALHNGLGFGSTEFHVLRAHQGISPQFIYYFVSSRAFRHVPSGRSVIQMDGSFCWKSRRRPGRQSASTERPTSVSVARRPS